MISNTMSGCQMIRNAPLGPLSPSFDPQSWLTDILDRNLTDETCKQVYNTWTMDISCFNDLCTCPQVSGRLHVSTTRVYDGSNLIINQFSNKEEIKTV